MGQHNKISRKYLYLFNYKLFGPVCFRVSMGDKQISPYPSNASGINRKFYFNITSIIKIIVLTVKYYYILLFKFTSLHIFRGTFFCPLGTLVASFPVSFHVQHLILHSSFPRAPPASPLASSPRASTSPASPLARAPRGSSFFAPPLVSSPRERSFPASPLTLSSRKMLIFFKK